MLLNGKPEWSKIHYDKGDDDGGWYIIILEVPATIGVDANRCLYFQTSSITPVGFPRITKADIPFVKKAIMRFYNKHRGGMVNDAVYWLEPIGNEKQLL